MPKNILIAPLNWGLGHATRCIPLIEILIEQGFNPIIASDGNALVLLRKEFPKLSSLELPSYRIRYAKNKSLKWQMIKRMPILIKAIREENKRVALWVNQGKIDGIISDNRFGVHSTAVPSVYISHQLQVLSGLTSGLSSYIHQRYMKNFAQIWVPDQEPGVLSGKLSSSTLSHKFIGILSRLKKYDRPIKYAYLIVLSGPEPQRTQLENRLLLAFKDCDKPVLFIRGVFNSNAISIDNPLIKIQNYALTKDLELAMNESEVIIARSGYSTISDLAKLSKKAIFIPTPGQYEQVYLAQYLEEAGIAPFVNQDQFNLEQLDLVKYYSGFKQRVMEPIDPRLFELFKGK